MSTYLTTGTSRGIGLELVRQLLQLPTTQVSKIFAVTRFPALELQAITNDSQDRVQNIIIPDITQESSVQQGVAQVEKALNGKGLDVLINNAGKASYTPNGVASVPANDMRDVFNVNTVSAHVVTAAFLPLLRKGKEKKIVNVSSTMGPITTAPSFNWQPLHSYQISKAAMNMLTVLYAQDLASEGFTVLALSPGWLKTDLGSLRADLDVATGVKATLDIVLQADGGSNGKFFNIEVEGWEGYQGGEYPW